MWMVTGPETCDQLYDVDIDWTMPLFFGQTIVIENDSVEFCLFGTEHGTLTGSRIDLGLPLARFGIGAWFQIDTLLEAEPIKPNLTEDASVGN